MSDDELLAAYIRLLPCARAVKPTEQAAKDLTPLYTELPDGMPRLPRLYEHLLLSYSWNAPGGDDFGGYDLFAGRRPFSDCPYGYNLLGNAAEKPSLKPVSGDMPYDTGLRNILTANRYFLFGQGGRQQYDPVCFDLNRMRGRDCPVVGIDHEAILCYNRIRITVELAPTFRELVKRTIQEEAMP